MGRLRSTYEPDQLDTIQQSGLSLAQLRRSISFIDVNGDGSIAEHELLGALTSTDLTYPEIRTLMKKLMPKDDESNGEDAGSRGHTDLQVVKERLIQLLGSSSTSNSSMADSQKQLKDLALRALVKLLEQREDEAKRYEWSRVFKSLVVSLFPYLTMPCITECHISPTYCGKRETSIWIPQYFKSSSKVWSINQWSPLMTKLEDITLKINNLGGGVWFGLSDVIFTVELNGRNQQQYQLPTKYYVTFQKATKGDDGRHENERKE